MKTLSCLMVSAGLGLGLAGCAEETREAGTDPSTATAPAGGPSPAPGVDEGPVTVQPSGAHDEVSLGTVSIGAMAVELAQGHGPLVAGHESHLVVKLSDDDRGATVVRAWIGGEDRSLALVGKGDFNATHGDYDLHAMAPDPLPENCRWWIELERPDGTTVVGSAAPILE